MELKDLPEEMIQHICSFITNPATYYVSKQLNYYMKEYSPFKSIIKPKTIVYKGEKLSDTIDNGMINTQFVDDNINLKLKIRYWKDEDENIEVVRKLKVKYDNVVYERALIDCEIYLFVQHEVMPYHFNYKKEFAIEKISDNICKYVSANDVIGYISDFDFSLKKIIIKYNRVILLNKDMIQDFDNFYE